MKTSLHFVLRASSLVLALAALPAGAQQTETGGAAGFRPGMGTRLLDAAWAATNHVRRSAYFEDHDQDLLENWAEAAFFVSPWTNDLAGVAAPAAAAGALDLVPGKWKAANGFALADKVARDDTDNDGWDNWSEWLAGTDPRSAESAPNPRLSVTLDYRGAIHADVVVHCYSRSDMNGWPDAVYRVRVASSAWPVVVELSDADLVFGHLRQGRNWFFAWANADGSTLASVNGGDWPTWTDPEPAAIADNQLDGLGIGFGRNELTFHLTDKAESFARVSWQGKLPEDSAGYRVLIESPELFFASDATATKKSIKWPRTWIHEGDIIAYNRAYGGADSNFGLGALASATTIFPEDTAAKTLPARVSTETAARQSSGTDSYVTVCVVTNWTHSSSALPTPAIYSPDNGEAITSSTVEFRFSLDPEYTEFMLELWKGTRKIYDRRVLAPGRLWNDATKRRDLVAWRFPYCVDDLSEVAAGTTYHFSPGASYTWKVTAYSPALKSGASAQQSATGSFQTAAAPSRGAIMVAAGNVSTNAPQIRVCAYGDPACSGLPLGVARADNAPSASPVISGLERGRPYWIKGECGDALGFVSHDRRPVPVFAESADAISITNSIVIRNWR